jgi:hypothetical protein
VIFDNGVGTVSGTVTLPGDLTVNTGETLTIPSDASLTIPSGKTLTNNGSLTNSGTLTNDGSFVVAADATFTNNGTLTGTSTIAELSALSISQGTLSPAFAGTTYAYTASVANNIASVNITATPVSGATVSGDTGTKSLTVGSNVFTIKVTSADGENDQNYTVTITRGASTAAKLSALSLSQGTLSPAFAGTTYDYTTSVENSISSVNISATPVSGATVSGDTGTKSLTVGSNVFTIKVTSADGINSQNYTVTITRKAAVDVPKDEVQDDVKDVVKGIQTLKGPSFTKAQAKLAKKVDTTAKKALKKITKQAKKKVKVGKKVTLKAKSIKGFKVSYQWYAGNKAIDKATKKTYKIEKKYTGKKLVLKISYTTTKSAKVTDSAKYKSAVYAPTKTYTYNFGKTYK